MENANYVIISIEYYNKRKNHAIVLGKHKTLNKFVTWEYSSLNNSFFWGHYFDDKLLAIQNYHERLADNYRDQIPPFEYEEEEQ